MGLLKTFHTQILGLRSHDLDSAYPFRHRWSLVCSDAKNGPYNHLRHTHRILINAGQLDAAPLTAPMFHQLLLLPIICVIIVGALKSDLGFRAHPDELIFAVKNPASCSSQ